MVFIAASGCTGEDSTSSTVDSETESVDSTTATAAKQFQASLTQVRYECGPTDATVISFSASASDELEGTAELIVLDSPFGSIPVRLSPEPSDYAMDIDLNEAAFDAADGEVRVVTSDEIVVATEPVRLRLPDGVQCG